MAIRRFTALLILALTGMVILVNAAGSNDETKQHRLASAPAAAPSDVDVHYAHMMVMHHQQAIRMSRTLIAMKDVPERIRLIAEFIVRDQQREVDATNAWLVAWGEQPVAPGQASGTAAQGMLTDAQLNELASAADYLRLMIDHHRGAVTMSRSLLDAGEHNAYVRTLSKHVINEQSAEIDAMQALL